MTLFSRLPFDAARPALLTDGSGDDSRMAEPSDPSRMTDPERQLTALATTTPDAIVTIDAENVVRYANPAVEQVFGYSPEELVGEPLTTLMDDEVASEHRSAFARYLETDERTLDWSGVELPGRHRDGSAVPLSVSFTEFTHDGERLFTGILRDVSLRKRRERELERTNVMLETVDDGVYALDDEGRFIAMNRAYAEMVGYDRETLLGEPASTVTGPDVAAELAEIQADLRDSDRDAVTYESTIRRGDGTRVPVETRVSPFPMGEGRYGQTGVVRDVTDRKRREEQLRQLNELSQALTAVETAQAVYDVAVETAQETLGHPLTYIDVYDDERGRLVPASRTPEVEALVGDGSPFAADCDVPWRVYTEQDGRVLRDVDANDAIDAVSELSSAIVLPLASHGVFVAGSADAAAFDDDELTLAKLFVATVEAALDRVDREAELRERTEALENRTRTLERINRINSVIRELTGALTRASTREEIQEVVCVQLANAEPYCFAWIGEPQAVDGEVEPLASAGLERGYLDAITVTTDDEPTGEGPTGRAVRTHEIQVQNNLHSDPPFEPWRTAALQRGYRASIAIPLRHRETLYGVLNLYADETGVFDDLEVGVLEELGEMIGYAINALERKKALVSETAVELQFDINDPDVPAVQFARAEDGRIEFEALVEEAGGTLRVFFTVYGSTPERVEEHVKGSTTIRELNLVSERDDGYFYEATVTEASFFGRLLESGAHPTALVATPEGAQLTVELPSSGDITAFLQMFTTRFEDAELRSRRELGRPIRTEEEFQVLYKDRLTERQEEVVKTAYHAGFFNFPRDSTGSDVAELLGVSQPTVNRHIRQAERKLFELVFDDPYTDVADE